MTLDEIAIKFNTDKSSKGHFYTKCYENHFKDISKKELKILEIGIQNGFSLKTWKEYFENSQIFGIDLTDMSNLNEDRITTLVCNQRDVSGLKNINDSHGPFDIIIDDGSHRSDDIRISFNCLFPLLKEGGYYVVEDLHTTYWEKKKEQVGWFINENHDTFLNDVGNLIDDVNARGKSGHGNSEFDDIHATEELSWWEKNVESVCAYRSIVFIKKDKL